MYSAYKLSKWDAARELLLVLGFHPCHIGFFALRDYLVQAQEEEQHLPVFAWMSQRTGKTERQCRHYVVHQTERARLQGCKAWEKVPRYQLHETMIAGWVDWLSDHRAVMMTEEGVSRLVWVPCK